MEEKALVLVAKKEGAVYVERKTSIFVQERFWKDSKIQLFKFDGPGCSSNQC